MNKLLIIIGMIVLVIIVLIVIGSKQPDDHEKLNPHFSKQALGITHQRETPKDVSPSQSNDHSFDPSVTTNGRPLDNQATAVPTKVQTKTPEQMTFDMANQFLAILPESDYTSQVMGNDEFTKRYLNDYDWAALLNQSYQLWRESQRVWAQLLLVGTLSANLRAKLPDRLPKPFFSHLKDFDMDRTRMLTGNAGEQKVMNHLQNSNLHGYARILTDVNLPFRYRSGDPIKQNQIDILLVSTHGLFAFEVKNYQAKSVSIEDINGVRNLYYQHKDEFLDPHHVVSRLIKRNNTKNEFIVYQTLQNQYVVADAKFNSIGFQTQNHRYALDRAVGHLLHKWNIESMKAIHSPVVYTGPQVGNIYNHSYFHKVQIYLANQLANRLFHRYPRQVLLPVQVDDICERLKRISSQEAQRPRWVIAVSPADYAASLDQWRTQLSQLKLMVDALQG